MPRKKADNGGDEGSSKAGTGGSTEIQIGDKEAGTEQTVVIGKPKDIFVQMNEARGEGEESDKAKEAAEHTDGAAEEAFNARAEADPELKARQIVNEAQTEFNKKFGRDPNQPAGVLKVELSDEGKGAKLYQGRITLQSVHGETLEKISFVTVETFPRGEEYLFYVMKTAHPHAMREHFEIDPDNKTDPFLRSRYE